uniref:C2H2-type domain-containing protein n=1 Tax=Meloidogyne hapla TaxID=6305 RepID=A0A1I8BIK9_MELHA
MIIIQLIIFLCLFLTPIEGPPKGKHEGSGPSDGANELIVPDNLDKTNKKKYENRIKFLNELGDDKDKYNIFAQIGKVEEIYCNRCGKNVINSQKHYRADIISHNKAHKKMESPFPASAEGKKDNKILFMYHK